MQASTAGARLKILRGGRTVSQVAKDIGIAQSTLSMYECGLRVPRDGIKIKLAEYYGTTVEKIFFAK